MSEKSSQYRSELLKLKLTPGLIEIEKVVQLSRIADALEAIEETGVYVYQQGTEEEPEPRRRG